MVEDGVFKNPDRGVFESGFHGPGGLWLLALDSPRSGHRSRGSVPSTTAVGSGSAGKNSGRS